MATEKPNPAKWKPQSPRKRPGRHSKRAKARNRKTPLMGPRVAF